MDINDKKRIKRVRDKLKSIPGDYTGLTKTRLKKQSLINEVAKSSGDITQATKKLGITGAQLRKYLADGNFKEKLSAIQDELASELLQIGYSRALNGSERMIEFLLPAFDNRFDAGIRRQQVANSGLLNNALFRSLLDVALPVPDPGLVPGELSDNRIMDAPSLPSPTESTDNISYQSIPKLSPELVGTILANANPIPKPPTTD